jgi:hypothetical protein
MIISATPRPKRELQITPKNGTNFENEVIMLHIAVEVPEIKKTRVAVTEYSRILYCSSGLILIEGLAIRKPVNTSAKEPRVKESMESKAPV